MALIDRAHRRSITPAMLKLALDHAVTRGIHEAPA